MKFILKVESKREQDAILKNNQGQTVVWPLNALPSNINIGEELSFTVNKETDIKENELIAKNIINEILNDKN